MWIHVFSGGILMIGYYCCCHPTGRTAETKKDLTAYWFKRANSLPVSLYIYL